MIKDERHTVQSLWPIFSDLAVKCVSNKIDLILEHSTHVIAEDGVKCSGYFTSEPHARLAVAMKKPLQQWLPVILHESSHMDQFLENCAEWKALKLPDGSDAVEQIFEWVSDNTLHSREYISDCIDRAIAIELDCEIRTVDKIMRYSVSDLIKISTYIQQANSYVYFYRYVLETGKFYSPGKEPYNNPNVWKHAPSQFLPLEAYEHVPVNLLSAFRQHC